ncbi:RNA polymerase sigma70 factor [Roseivivax halodurans JCM 10272]|uniref:RNA polymerase sigma70 factor n=1 Tax=Roseivivax halodurans JCM 10272 TaxID=1449350 RepID=X7EAH5_9RHOB|nr:RNA polymerase sigma factor [Roseivivax halodurans]ETX12907.1 RNA polymerase sigma70 factor [Roseivivax halodurans JCM 10272]
MSRTEPPFEERLIAVLPNLFRFALSLCRARDVAEDLVQITVMRALESQGSFDPETRIEPWSFRILRNAWIDMTRRRATRGPEADIDEAAEAVGEDGRRVTEARLMVDATEQALDTLPASQREVLILVCYEEMSYSETSEILGVPLGTVMSRLSRARIALAEALGLE